MKAIVYLFMVMGCLYGIPKEEWALMDDAQRDAVLEDLGQDAIKELQCDEVEMFVDIEGKLVSIYGECIEGQYVAYWTGGSAGSKRLAREGGV